MSGPTVLQYTPHKSVQDCVDKAKKMIDDAIEKAKERTGGPNPNACSVKVPHELIGMLIGRGGETIKDRHVRKKSCHVIPGILEHSLMHWHCR